MGKYWREILVNLANDALLAKISPYNTFNYTETTEDLLFDSPKYSSPFGKILTNNYY